MDGRRGRGPIDGEGRVFFRGGGLVGGGFFSTVLCTVQYVCNCGRWWAVGGVQYAVCAGGRGGVEKDARGWRGG